jgi:hypothetical protein
MVTILTQQNYFTFAFLGFRFPQSRQLLTRLSCLQNKRIFLFPFSCTTTMRTSPPLLALIAALLFLLSLSVLISPMRL